MYGLRSNGHPSCSADRGSTRASTRQNGSYLHTTLFGALKRLSIHTTTQNKQWESDIADAVKMCSSTTRDTLFSVYEGKLFKLHLCPRF